MDAFGRWITLHDWGNLINLRSVRDKLDLFSTTMSEAMVDWFFPLQRTKCCTSEKPWITSKLKTLILRRQKSFVLHGKDSPTFKYWRNRVQQECKTCRNNFYERKFAALKDSNVKRWWKEIEGLTGQRSTADSWAFQRLDENIPSLTALVDCFNDFLAGLTAHVIPLDLTDCELDLEVPREFLVDQRVVYKALRQIKPNMYKSPGPSPIPKEFAAELCPVLTDIYNSSLKQGYVPAQLKESLVRHLPKVSPPKSVDSDLRPITLNAQIAKIMEGFTLSSLYSQVIDNIDFLQFALPENQRRMA